jgi:hypothetical protein
VGYLESGVNTGITGWSKKNNTSVDARPPPFPGATVSGMAKYSGITEDYARAFKAQKGMQIDLWPASHASQFKLHEKYRPGDAFNPDRFVDPQGFKTSVEQLEKTYREQLARERAKTR